MRKVRIIITVLVSVTASVMGILPIAEAIDPFSIMSSPDWYIEFNDAGYSDWMIQTFPGQEEHENLSGEWGAAIRYDGITPDGVSMWLTPDFICPDFTTNSTFWTETPIGTWDDPDNTTVGMDTGYSKILNGVVAIEISYSMHDTGIGVAAGLRPGGVGSTPPVMSSGYVLEATYNVTNISSEPLTNVRFFQFLHAHPNDDYDPNNYGVYDPTEYAEGAFTEYRYDITQYGASIHNPPGSDMVGFSSADEPTTWGIGDFPGHDLWEPATGLHFDLYDDMLPLTTWGGPTEIAGAMKWDYETLPPGESFSKSVLLYNGYTLVQIPPPVIEVDEVEIDIKPGSCPNPLNVKSKGVLPVAVLGTEEFDVTAIDPATIQITRAGYDVGVSPLAWHWEDAGTPFEGELCDCHDLHGDGYGDLILMFRTQEVKDTLGLEAEADNTIPLIVTGSLNEEADGTPIEGSDCVWVLRRGREK